MFPGFRFSLQFALRLFGCALMVTLFLLPGIAFAQEAGGQVADGKIQLDVWQLILGLLAALLPALLAHFAAWFRSDKPWWKIVDVIAGNYLKARNDPGAHQ